MEGGSLGVLMKLVLASLCRSAEGGEKGKWYLAAYRFAYCLSYS